MMAHRINWRYPFSLFWKRSQLLVNLSKGSYIKRLRMFCKMNSLASGLRVKRVLAVAVPSSCFVVHALTAEEKKVERTVKAADELYDAAHYEELLSLLYPERQSENAEILWRLARALFEKSRDIQDQKEKLAVLEEAYGCVNKALEVDDNCGPAHKWCAILTDYVWRYKNTKMRIVQSFETRKHMERAIELNPQDSTSYYILGEWCFAFADMPWYQRKVASVIFASPPTSTYAEALRYFEEAEKICPQFYSMNLLMIGKCLLKLDQVEKGVTFLQQARNYPLNTPDDKQAHEEATKLLKDLGISG